MHISTGDTTFMMLCTAMVCLMTPGLAFFYGGLSRSKNVLLIMMESFVSMGIVTLIWIFGGFGLAFGRDVHGIIGMPTDYFALHNVSLVPNAVHAASIPLHCSFVSIDVLRDYGSVDYWCICTKTQRQRVRFDAYFLDDSGLSSGMPLGLGKWFSCENGIR